MLLFEAEMNDFLEKKILEEEIMARNALKTSEDIRKKLKQLLIKIEKGEVENLAEARLMVNILSEMLKSIRQDELEKQLAEIEEQLSNMKGK